MHSQNRIVMKSLKSLLNPNVITQFRNNNRRYLKLQYFPAYDILFQRSTLTTKSFCFYFDVRYNQGTKQAILIRSEQQMRFVARTTVAPGRRNIGLPYKKCNCSPKIIREFPRLFVSRLFFYLLRSCVRPVFNN